MTHNRTGLRGHLRESFAKESFPPKWLLVVAILAVIAGLSWANFRIAAAESQLTTFAERVESTCDDKRPVFADSKQVCEEAAEKANGANPAPVPALPLQEPQSGRDGRGVASMECVIQSPRGNGIWQVTYTDHELDPDAGPCFAP
jgi:hypothetical protein